MTDPTEFDVGDLTPEERRRLLAIVPADPVEDFTNFLRQPRNRQSVAAQLFGVPDDAA